MNKEVILKPSDLHSELLSPYESRQIQKAFDDKVFALYEKKLDDDTEQTYLFEYIQQKCRDILALTRPRIDTKDVLGRPILSTEEYKQRIAAMTGSEAVRFRSTISAPVTFKRNGEPHVVNVDYNLAPFLQRLADSGYGTGQSDSGTLSDHPNYRYVSDSKQGLYAEGECIYFNKQGSGAYLTFWKPEATVVKGMGDVVCTQEQIDDICRIASEQGWIVEDTDVFFQPSVRVSLPLTYDGTAKQDILHAASARTNDALPGLKEKDFLQWLEQRTPFEHEEWQKHGGVVMYTDQMILDRWEKLTQALEVTQKLHQLVKDENERQEQLFARITDVTIFTGGDGYWRIKCKIDGKSQISERMADHEMKAINKGTPAKVFAVQKYEDILNAPQEDLDKGLKR